MVSLNTIVGLYRRNPGRTSAQTTARISLSLLLAVPVAWGDLHVPAAHRGMERNVAVAVPIAFVTFVAIRELRCTSGMSPLFARRTLVLGIGAEAVAVEQSIAHVGRRSGSWASIPRKRAKRRTRWSANAFSADGIDLVDAVRRYKVDEIIVAVRERRGGVLPLRELLDCKLMGVRVLDLSSYYERAVGQLRLDSLHASWLIFGEGFRQGFTRSFVKRLFDVAASSLLLLLAAPVMVATAVGIALESGFPILYRQERVGRAVGSST
jgi:hypothetical protein